LKYLILNSTTIFGNLAAGSTLYRRSQPPNFQRRKLLVVIVTLATSNVACANFQFIFRERYRYWSALSFKTIHTGRCHSLSMRLLLFMISFLN
jgi:hypothetical protein